MYVNRVHMTDDGYIGFLDRYGSTGDSHPIILERRGLRRDATVEDIKWCRREKGIKLSSTLTKQEARCKIAARRFQLSSTNNLDKYLLEIQDADGLHSLLRSHPVLFSLVFEYIQ